MIHDRRAANTMYLIHAPHDAALAEQISRDLAVHGSTVHGTTKITCPTSVPNNSSADRPC